MLNGQLTIFDNPDNKKRPCEYSFRRYIGQEVVFITGWEKLKGMKPKAYGRIIRIEPYYTFVKTTGGKELVGTPGTIYPKETQ